MLSSLNPVDTDWAHLSDIYRAKKINLRHGRGFSEQTYTHTSFWAMAIYIRGQYGQYDQYG